MKGLTLGGCHTIISLQVIKVVAAVECTLITAFPSSKLENIAQSLV